MTSLAIGPEDAGADDRLSLYLDVTLDLAYKETWHEFCEAPGTINEYIELNDYTNSYMPECECIDDDEVMQVDVSLSAAQDPHIMPNELVSQPEPADPVTHTEGVPRNSAVEQLTS